MPFSRYSSSFSAASTCTYSRRELLRLAASGVVTASCGSLFSGCARENNSKARVTLTQWYHQYGEKGTQDAVMRYAQEYSKAFPDVAVQVVWVPGDYGTKINTALLTRGGPDVFEKQLTVPMVSAGQVAPLDDLFTPALKSDFLDKDLFINRVDGKIYGIKMVSDTGVLYYRKSLFDKANISPPKNWDELIDAAKKLNSRKQRGLYLGNDGGIGALLTIAPWSAGSDFLIDDKIVFNNERTLKAYEKLRDLNRSGALLEGAPTDWWDPSAFNDGLCAMQWGGLWAYPAIRERLKDDVGAMAWPALDEQGTPATFAGGWSQMVNSRSPQLEEAKKYVKWLWLENTKIQTDWNLSYGFHVPPRQSVARSAKALSEPVPKAAVEAVSKYGRAMPPAWSASMNTALSDAVANIVKQGRKAAPEIELAAQKCERELKRLLI